MPRRFFLFRFLIRLLGIRTAPIAVRRQFGIHGRQKIELVVLLVRWRFQEAPESHRLRNAVYPHRLGRAGTSSTKLS